jgi:hypothetical protein
MDPAPALYMIRINGHLLEVRQLTEDREAPDPVTAAYRDGRWLRVHLNCSREGAGPLTGGAASPKDVPTAS